MLTSKGASRPMAAAKLVITGAPLPSTWATTPMTPAAPASLASAIYSGITAVKNTAWLSKLRGWIQYAAGHGWSEGGRWKVLGATRCSSGCLHVQP